MTDLHIYQYALAISSLSSALALAMMYAEIKRFQASLLALHKATSLLAQTTGNLTKDFNAEFDNYARIGDIEFLSRKVEHVRLDASLYQENSTKADDRIMNLLMGHTREISLHADQLKSLSKPKVLKPIKGRK